MTSLAQEVLAARISLAQDLGEARALKAAGNAAQQRAELLRSQIEQHERVLGVLTQVGEERQQHAQAQVEGLVTQGLQAIFGESLSFHLVQSVRGGQAQVDFMLRSRLGDKKVETPVMDARGGGMAAVVGFLLRLVVLLLTPGARCVLFLDESFAHVSAEYRPALGQFLREVCDRAGVQIVMVTHDPEYAEQADTVYRFSLKEGMTEAT